MHTIRVIVADDHPIVRAGLKNLLTGANIDIVGEAATGGQALDLARQLQPDILLLDMELPDLSGLEVAHRIREENIPVNILVLSAHDDASYIRALLQLGAAGYLTKEEAPEFIIEAIRSIADGQQGWVSRRVAARMAAWVRTGRQGPAPLTPRELEVLRLVAEGKTNQNIGAELGISEKTVEKHLVAIFAKLGVSSRVEAAVHAVRDDLV